MSVSANNLWVLIQALKSEIATIDNFKETTNYHTVSLINSLRAEKKTLKQLLRLVYADDFLDLYATGKESKSHLDYFEQHKTIQDSIRKKLLFAIRAINAIAPRDLLRLEKKFGLATFGYQTPDQIDLRSDRSRAGQGSVLDRFLLIWQSIGLAERDLQDHDKPFSITLQSALFAISRHHEGEMQWRETLGDTSRRSSVEKKVNLDLNAKDFDLALGDDEVVGAGNANSGHVTSGNEKSDFQAILNDLMGASQAQAATASSSSAVSNQPNREEDSDSDWGDDNESDVNDNDVKVTAERTGVAVRFADKPTVISTAVHAPTTVSATSVWTETDEDFEGDIDNADNISQQGLEYKLAKEAMTPKAAAARTATAAFTPKAGSDNKDAKDVKESDEVFEQQSLEDLEAEFADFEDSIKDINIKAGSQRKQMRQLFARDKSLLAHATKYMGSHASQLSANTFEAPTAVELKRDADAQGKNAGMRVTSSLEDNGEEESQTQSQRVLAFLSAPPVGRQSSFTNDRNGQKLRLPVTGFNLTASASGPAKVPVKKPGS